MSWYCIGLGSNVGDRRRNLRRALEVLRADPDIEVRAVSSLYRTSPVGYNDQRDFYNAAVEIASALAPRELLSRLREIEGRLGRRTGGPRWGPRVIDLDILLWGGGTVTEEDLVIPHPRLAERRFALVPLAEIAPGARHPGTGRTAAGMLAALDNDERITRLGDWDG